MSTYDKLDQWIDAHFDEQVKFLQELVRVPTDTPPGNNTPHAIRTAELLQTMGMPAEQFEIPAALVREHGLASITNLIVRRRYGEGRVIALNAHGDVVPPGEVGRTIPTAQRLKTASCTVGHLRSANATFPPSPLRCVRLKQSPNPPKVRSNCISLTTKSSAANWGGLVACQRPYPT